jgi:hypothetical protein
MPAADFAASVGDVTAWGDDGRTAYLADEEVARETVARREGPTYDNFRETLKDRVARDVADDMAAVPIWDLNDLVRDATGDRDVDLLIEGQGVGIVKGELTSGTARYKLTQTLYRNGAIWDEDAEYEGGKKSFDEWVDEGNRRGDLTLRIGYETDRPVGAFSVGEKSAESATRFYAASQLTHTWASTSNDSNPLSLGLQEAIRANFNVGDTMDADGMFDGSIGTSFYGSHTRALDGYVQTTYRRTQSTLEAAGIGKGDLITVHRGMTVVDNYGYRQGTRFQGELRPASSFSTSRGIASQFGDDPDVGSGVTKVVIEADVPRSQIFSAAATGPGCYGENEVVVIGPSVQATVTYADAGEPDWDTAFSEIWGGSYGEPGPQSVNVGV